MCVKLIDTGLNFTIEILLESFVSVNVHPGIVKSSIINEHNGLTHTYLREKTIVNSWTLQRRLFKENYQ